jgi:hypothetical protein
VRRLYVVQFQGRCDHDKNDIALLCLIRRSGRGRLMLPQGRDSQVSNPLSGEFFWPQLTIPDHAELALADRYDLGGAAIIGRP